MTTLYRTDPSAVAAEAAELFGGSKLDDMGADRYSTKVAAARIREDVKTALKAGLIRKGVKISVRMRDHNCIYLTVTKAPFICLNPEAVIERKNVSDMSQWRCELLTREAQGVLNLLQLIQLQYNYDNSDIQSDYFDVNFYCYVSIDSDLEYAERDGVLALAARGLKVKAAA